MEADQAKVRSGSKADAPRRARPYISWRLERAGLSRLVKDWPAASRSAAARSAVLEQPVQTGDRLAVRCKDGSARGARRRPATRNVL